MQVPSRPTGAQSIRRNLILLVLLPLAVSACALSQDLSYQALRPTFEPLLLAPASPAPPILTGEARATAPEGIPIPSISSPSAAPPAGSSVSSTPTVPSPTLITPSAFYDCPATGRSDYETAVIALVNSARAAHGLPSLTPQTQLTAAAREHNFDMACNNFASHTGSDGSTLRERVGRQGYTFSWIGENYYVGHVDPQSAFSWWMNSTPHRDNILNVHYSQIGVGYAWDASSPYGGYYTIDFGHP